jgi:hypothetical protein
MYISKYFVYISKYFMYISKYIVYISNGEILKILYNKNLLENKKAKKLRLFVFHKNLYEISIVLLKNQK